MTSVCVARLGRPYDSQRRSLYSLSSCYIGFDFTWMGVFSPLTFGAAYPSGSAPARGPAVGPLPVAGTLVVARFGGWAVHVGGGESSLHPI